MEEKGAREAGLAGTWGLSPKKIAWQSKSTAFGRRLNGV